ncbi:acireductone synthase [Synechococcus lacustris]|uniref:acireductone synthase n=1 Tax=Synechococcus lacustris TaxID=2116544 RepID=UPI0020CE21A9|nr:acireductone synthase [Synechococcus lacustris]MCP9793969.1 acireductone synthase [Synechococcus lacustris L1F-Slac]MCP9813158.1 acireductone synthase [Synechococcus lacustris L1E-Slac]
MIKFNGLKGVVLDIEGTTCPIDFVANELFPYAHQALPKFVAEHSQDEQLKELWDEVKQAMQIEQTKGAPKEIASYLQWLIKQDRKFSPLKELQGIIWQEGYGAGKLKAPLFDDVGKALNNWHQMGLKLAVYSSGSVAAQKLLYSHSSAGDLSKLFSNWFDTRLGSKLDQLSYSQLAKTMAIPADALLFISDAPEELNAAKKAGYQTCGSQRARNKFIIDNNLFNVVTSFSSLELELGNQK